MILYGVDSGNLQLEDLNAQKKSPTGTLADSESSLHQLTQIKKALLYYNMLKYATFW